MYSCEDPKDPQTNNCELKQLINFEYKRNCMYINNNLDLLQILLNKVKLLSLINKIKNNNATLILYSNSSFWGTFYRFILSISNRIFISWFGILMFPLLSVASIFYILGFLCAPTVDIDGIREPVAGPLLYCNNIISVSIISSSNAIGVHFYFIWKLAITID